MTSADLKQPKNIHRRSRYGCKNCKHRKVKCDGSRPQCQKCVSFGIICSFVSSGLEMQPTVCGIVRLVKRNQQQLARPLPGPVWPSDGMTRRFLDFRCQELIFRYLGRSLITPDDPAMIQVNQKLLELAFERPYLMHASLAVAFAFDRHLSRTLPYRRTVEECQHWTKSAILFRAQLDKGIEPQDRDAIWGTAAALATLSIASPDASTPEQSWPLNTAGSTNLDWLRMNEAKMSLWNLVQPLRPDSIFSVLSETFADMTMDLNKEEAVLTFKRVAAVCGVGPFSNANNNPYYHAAQAVARIMDLPDTKVTTGEAALFTRYISGSFKALIEQKDPVALLLLYLWYSKASRSVWWIGLRARIEGPAICAYLQAFHKDNTAVLSFLEESSRMN